MFPKLKKYKVTIKGSVWKDGRKKQNWISKEGTSSPTMSTEGLILSWIFDAMEGRDVATADTPGAFLQTYCDKGDIHINMKGEMVNLL